MNSTLSILLLIATLHVGLSGASEFTMPFGLSLTPGARLLISDVHDSGADTREESVARYGTRLPLQEVIAFYQTALVDAGFKISVPTDNGDSMGITGKRGRDRIRVSVKKEGSWAEVGENELTIVAVYDK